MEQEVLPVSEDLKEAAKRYATEGDEISGLYIIDEEVEAFKAGAKWQKEQFEKNRLKHCNSITNEQAELEQGFIDQHLDKYNRMPTFLDAIEYGMRLQKEQMMEKAVNGVITFDYYRSESIDFEQELYKAFGQVKDFTLGMRIAKYFFELGMAVSNKVQ